MGCFAGELITSAAANRRARWDALLSGFFAPAKGHEPCSAKYMLDLDFKGYPLPPGRAVLTVDGINKGNVRCNLSSRCCVTVADAAGDAASFCVTQ